MRKSLKLFTLGFTLMFVSLIKVNAATDITTEQDLRDCVDVDGSTCKLAGDIVLTSDLDIEKDITLDLNGHTITADSALTLKSCLIAVIHGGTLTIEDSVGTGKISPGSNIYGAVQVTKDGKTDTSKTATLIVNGGTIEGYYYGIQGNGKADRVNTSITINGGYVLGTAVGDNLGIYHPQVGELVINGGIISGVTGIEMRAGTLVVNGGTIEGTGTSFSVVSNTNGSTTMGAAVALAQHTTAQALSANISGGILKGYTGLYQGNPENNDTTAIKLVTLSITGGEFISTNTDATTAKAIYSENVTEFITGGTFNTKFENNYLGDDVTVETLQDGDGSYVVKAPSATSSTAPTVEVKDEENPNTGDNVIAFIIIGLMSLIIGAIATNKLRKNA